MLPYRLKTYQTGFLFCRLGHAPGVGHVGGTGGCQKFNFSEHGHVAYQIEGDMSRTEYK